MGYAEREQGKDTSSSSSDDGTWLDSPLRRIEDLTGMWTADKWPYCQRASRTPLFFRIKFSGWHSLECATPAVRRSSPRFTRHRRQHLCVTVSWFDIRQHSETSPPTVLLATIHLSRLNSWPIYRRIGTERCNKWPAHSCSLGRNLKKSLGHNVHLFK